MSLFVPECLEELQTAGSHRHCDDLCLTHLSTGKKSQHRKKKKQGGKKRCSSTFTCFVFLPAWAKMTFHFLPQVISKGLIQFALQAVSNPAHTPLNVSLPSSGTLLFGYLLLAFWHSCCYRVRRKADRWSLWKYQRVSLTKASHGYLISLKVGFPIIAMIGWTMFHAEGGAWH